MSSPLSFGKEVADILGIKCCRNISITHRYGHAPIAVVTVVLRDGEQLDKIKEVIKRHELKPKP